MLELKLMELTMSDEHILSVKAILIDLQIATVKELNSYSLLFIRA